MAAIMAAWTAATRFISLDLALRIHHVGLQGWISEVSQFEKPALRG
jgi:hypothetical protein